MYPRRAAQFGLCGALIATTLSAGSQPLAVSPGSATGTLIADPCPTLSWSGVAAAEGYELVVYRVGEKGEEADAVLRETLAGAASSWTPSLRRCLERGGRYAWSVRALKGTAVSEWSPPSLFKVAAGPSERELEQALAVVERYLAVREEETTSTADLPAAQPSVPAGSNASGFGPASAKAFATTMPPATASTTPSQNAEALPDGALEAKGVANQPGIKGFSSNKGGVGVVGENSSFGFRGLLGGHDFGVKSAGDMLVEAGDLLVGDGALKLTRTGDPKFLRLRTSGDALDLDFSSADLFLNGDVGNILRLKKNGEIRWKPQTSFLSVNLGIAGGALQPFEGWCNETPISSWRDCLTAVHLPHGATISKVTWYFEDKSSSNGWMKLIRSPLGVGDEEVLIEMESSNGVGLTYCPGAQVGCKKFVAATIADDANTYYLQYWLPDPDVYTWAARIEYTINRPH